MNRRDLSQPHRRRGQTGRWLLALIAGLVLGCAETRYAAYSDVAGMTELPYRTVVFEIGRAFYTDFPDCALIMPPAPTKGDGRFAALVEMALGRYLTGKFTRVINPTERDIVARRIAADLSQLEDRLALAEEVRCDSFVFTDLLGPRSKNLIVWSQIRVGLEVRMVRASDGHLLWRARHVASRSEGGLPLSPVSLVMETISSTRFSSDHEITASVVDDALRRLVATIPDARSYR